MKSPIIQPLDVAHQEAWDALPANVQRMLDHLRPPLSIQPTAAAKIRPTALERAFELARSGQFMRVDSIERVLRREGYYAEQLQGPVLRRQLRETIAECSSPLCSENRPAIQAPREHEITGQHKDRP